MDGSKVFELVLLEMREEFNRATAWDVDKELYFVREIGRNTFALPEANVLLEFTFHASDVNLGNSGHVVHLKRHRDLDPSSDGRF